MGVIWEKRALQTPRYMSLKVRDGEKTKALRMKVFLLERVCVCLRRVPAHLSPDAVYLLNEVVLSGVTARCLSRGGDTHQMWWLPLHLAETLRHIHRGTRSLDHSPVFCLAGH